VTRTPSTWAQQVDAAVKLDGIGLPFRQNLERLGTPRRRSDRAIKTRTDDALANVKAQLEASTRS
jgi:hypothetical protein